MLTKQRTENGKTTENSQTTIFLSEGLSKFISFGTNVILMRKLILDKLVGCIRTFTIDINGELHTINDCYRTPKLVTSTNNDDLKVQQIERFSIISDSGRASKSTSIFNSTTGHLLQDLSESSQYMIRCHSTDLTGRYDDDIQLLLLDYVTARRSTEFKDNSRVKNLLREFTKCVIASRPADLMDFTLNFLTKVERDAIVLKRSQKAATRRHQQNSSE